MRPPPDVAGLHAVNSDPARVFDPNVTSVRIKPCPVQLIVVDVGHIIRVCILCRTCISKTKRRTVDCAPHIRFCSVLSLNDFFFFFLLFILFFMGQSRAITGAGRVTFLRRQDFIRVDLCIIRVCVCECMKRKDNKYFPGKIKIIKYTISGRGQGMAC